MQFGSSSENINLWNINFDIYMWSWWNAHYYETKIFNVCFLPILF